MTEYLLALYAQTAVSTRGTLREIAAELDQVIHKNNLNSLKLDQIY